MAHNKNMRNIRVEDDLWNKARAKANGEHIPLAERIREFLEDYVGGVYTVEHELLLIGKRLNNIRKRLGE